MKYTYVTRPLMPPLEEYLPYLENIWESKQLTNGGPYHQQLEQALTNYLGVNYLSLFANGTLALITALQTLGITGEVITTPYSFVATSHSLLWNGIKPVFVDILPGTFNIDPLKIESAITPKTTAILAVHVYGYPCMVEDLQKIANNFGLKVIYDAAHAFGIDYKGKSILTYGDLSILSFHATKVFQTFEGGAIICPNIELKDRIDHLKNFGFSDETTVIAPGINAKMNELQAAFGLLQLKHIDRAIINRKKIDNIYRKVLMEIKGIECIPLSKHATSNFSYFPILVNNDYQLNRDELYTKLKSNGIYARRYFYPLISNFPMYKSLPSSNPINLKEANTIADKILCLPIYPDLDHSTIYKIANIIKSI